MEKQPSYKFSELNPITLAIYFFGISAVLIFTSHPLYTLGAFVSIILFRIYIHFDIKTIIQTLLWILTLAFANPLFSHHGNTPIIFINNKPYTIEALVYGVHLSLTLAAAFLWCSTAARCFTSDKIAFLLSSASPKIALILSMTLRYITLFKSEYKKIHDAKTLLGKADSTDAFGRLKTGAACFSTLFTNAIEFSAYTADSMLSRGFMLKKRSYYSDYTFSLKDICIIFVTLSSVFISYYSEYIKKAGFYYYPVISKIELNWQTALSSLLYFAVSMLVFLFEAAENVKWKLLESKI